MSSVLNMDQLSHSVYVNVCVCVHVYSFCDGQWQLVAVPVYSHSGFVAAL